MKYEFPEINHIDDVLWALEGSPEFIVAEREGYKVLNYTVSMPDTFPSTTPAGGSAKMRAEHKLRAALRRECRGIIFCSETGKLIRRPLHKFFNVNERLETQSHAVDFSEAHAVLDKLDGSMIAPFMLGDRMVWGTKMGDTDVAQPVHDFVSTRPEYELFAADCIERDITPIFEWCSRKQRIVLDYQEDQLILTAMRFMETGEYFNREAMMFMSDKYGIPLVGYHTTVDDISSFLEATYGLEGAEGFVVRFDDGHMVKVKSEWYCLIHKAKESILQDRNIVEMILDNSIDDVKAHLLAEDRQKLEAFEREFAIEFQTIVGGLITLLVSKDKNNVTRKDFALNYTHMLGQFTKSAMFTCWDDYSFENVSKIVNRTIRANLSKNAKYEVIREAWLNGIKYNEY